MESERLLTIGYTNNRLETSVRTVEPMTIAFRWRSWYLFAYCRLKKDYRLFRISRIRESLILDERFRRRDHTLESFLRDQGPRPGAAPETITLRFDPSMRTVVEEYYPESDREETEDGGLIVQARMPEDSWVYGYILSFGPLVEVVDPPRVRRIIRDSADPDRR